MGTLRNGFMALFVTGLLIGGLFVLFPEPVGAVQVHLTGGDITTPEASGAFNVTTRVLIPDGEHIAIDYAKVVVGNSSATLTAAGDLTGDILCTATTGGSPTATIVGVSGGTRVSAAFFGYGYEVAPSGGGYNFTNRTVAVSAGTGYGYGAGDAGDTEVTVKIRVTGCSITFIPNPLNVTIQSYVGSMADNFRSFPTPISMADPATCGGTGACTSNSTGVVTTNSTTTSGGQTTVDTTITPNGTGNDGVGTGVAIEINPTGAGNLQKISMTTKKTLPAGSRLVVTVDSNQTGGTGTKSSPPFGINSTVLSGQTPFDIAAFFQVKLFIPGLGEVDAADYFTSIDITVNVPTSYFTGGKLSGLFRLRGFTDAGSLKSSHPVMLSSVLNAPNYTFTFRITLFSSFAGFSGAGGGGGGGGGPAPTPTETPNATVPPVVTPTPSTSSPPIPTPTPEPTTTKGPIPTFDPDGPGGLSSGMWWLIVVGVVLGGGLVSVLLAVVLRKKEFQ